MCMFQYETRRLGSHFISFTIFCLLSEREKEKQDPVPLNLGFLVEHWGAGVGWCRILESNAVQNGDLQCFKCFRGVFLSWNITYYFSSSLHEEIWQAIENRNPRESCPFVDNQFSIKPWRLGGLYEGNIWCLYMFVV